MKNQPTSERPVETEAQSMDWVSDVAAEMLRRAGIRFIALNPGSSLRGFHDSLVNYLGNRDPQILLCLHEDHCTAIAHGYAKATGKAMAVGLHANVGLMHGLLGIYNAWCDRMPVFVVGANGPADASQRRPWMDWLHTTKDQGALIRNSVKWDDEPRSVSALIESMLRANLLMQSPPRAPVYVCLDVELQEKWLSEPVPIPPQNRFEAPTTPRAGDDVVERVTSVLSQAKRPVILVGRTSRCPKQWSSRVRLAELLGARVATDLKSGAAFPTDHPLHLPGLTLRISEHVVAAVRESDVILVLDWIDTPSLFAATEEQVDATVIRCSLDSYLSHGASMEHFGLAPADIDVLADSDRFVTDLVTKLETQLEDSVAHVENAIKTDESECDSYTRSDSDPSEIDPRDIAFALDEFRQWHDITLARIPIGWIGDDYHFRHPLDFLGYDGGGGLSSGPGNTIGSALGLIDTDRVVVGVLGDGDFLQAPGALWTAARYSIPALIIVSNNRSNYTDVGHQTTIARQRHRPVENSGIGQHITDPDVDIASLARSMGVEAFGPVTRFNDLEETLKKAFEIVQGGKPCLVDVIVERQV